MEECIFGHANFDSKNIEEGDWTERQYDQLKAQIQAYKYLLAHTTDVHNMDELNKALDFGGYSKMMWCGDRACEDKIKELTNATARCLPFNQMANGEICPVCGKKANKVVLFAKAY